MAVKIGDRVRFLNSIGGGIVRKFVSKDIVEVEDEDGFGIPTLIKECVVIESTVAQQVKENAPINNHTPRPVVLQEEEDDEEDFETKEGEALNVALGFVPQDIKALSSSPTDLYLINDSNYYLAYNVFTPSGNSVFSRAAGIISPNTKIELQTIQKEQLSDFENIGVQILALKKEKPYTQKPTYDLQFKINPVKFYKLHTYTTNDFFDNDAFILYLVKNDQPQDEKIVSTEELSSILENKETAFTARVSKKSNIKKEKIEVDLHIHELVDSTAGLTNKDMLDIQIKKFHEVMKANVANKGQKIVFIHGKGEGVLRKELLSQLKKCYPKCDFQDASFLEYGFGATQITIK